MTSFIQWFPKEKCTFKPALRCSLWVQGAKNLRKNAPSSRLWGAVCSAEVLFSYQYFALTSSPFFFCKQKRPVTLRSSRSQNYRPVCRIQFGSSLKTLFDFTNSQRNSCATLRILLGFIQIVPCSTAVFYPAYPLHIFSSFPALVRVEPSTTSASPSVVSLQRLIYAKQVFNR